MKTRFGLATLLAATFALPAGADIYADLGTTVTLVRGTDPMLPPADYQSQWWTSPDNCDYSRAGRPGEAVWYLIINTAHAGCATRLVQQAYDDYK